MDMWIKAELRRYAELIFKKPGFEFVKLPVYI
jgi:hypothetical protein